MAAVVSCKKNIDHLTLHCQPAIYQFTQSYSRYSVSLAQSVVSVLATDDHSVQFRFLNITKSPEKVIPGHCTEKVSRCKFKLNCHPVQYIQTVLFQNYKAPICGRNCPEKVANRLHQVLTLIQFPQEKNNSFQTKRTNPTAFGICLGPLECKTKRKETNGKQLQGKMTTVQQ